MNITDTIQARIDAAAEIDNNVGRIPILNSCLCFIKEEIAKDQSEVSEVCLKAAKELLINKLRATLRAVATEHNISF